MQKLRTRILFIFLDGVGLAPDGPDNPLSQVPMPHLAALLDGPLVLRRDQGGSEDGSGHAILAHNGLVLRAVDACLGVPGLPQSATGQTALFTGVNAPALIGDHVTAFPTQRLREVIADRSVLKQVADAGGKVQFANAHSSRFWELIRKRQRRLGASTLTALAADIPIPTLEDLAEGQAVLWDFTHEIASRHLGYELAVVSPEQAGERLARLASRYDLVLYESFLTDLAGHRRIEAEWVLTRLDSFLGAVLAHRTPDTTLVLCSDHGNLEDATTKAHTTNPVPLLAVGPATRCFEAAKAITDVAPAIISCLADRVLPAGLAATSEQ
jgi:2,3-bisphosphoglycerate-independent phosphoglycerate mutase